MDCALAFHWRPAAIGRSAGQGSSSRRGSRAPRRPALAVPCRAQIDVEASQMFRRVLWRGSFRITEKNHAERFTGIFIRINALNGGGS